MTSGRLGPVDSEVYEMRVSECQALTRRLSDPRAACRMLACGTRSYTSEGASLPLQRLMCDESRPTLRSGVFSVCLDLQVTASHKR